MIRGLEKDKSSILEPVQLIATESLYPLNILGHWEDL